MKRFRISTIALFANAWILCSVGCSDPSQPERIPLLQLERHAVDLAVGDSTYLGLLPLLPPGYVPESSWVSSDPATATVQKSGSRRANLTGVRPGQAVITVSGEGAADSATVTVYSEGVG